MNNPGKRAVAELYNDAVELLLDCWESRKVKDPDGQPLSLAEVLKLGCEGIRGLPGAERRKIFCLFALAFWGIYQSGKVCWYEFLP